MFKRLICFIFNKIFLHDVILRWGSVIICFDILPLHKRNIVNYSLPLLTLVQNYDAMLLSFTIENTMVLYWKLWKMTHAISYDFVYSWRVLQDVLNLTRGVDMLQVNNSSSLFLSLVDPTGQLPQILSQTRPRI